MRNRKLVYSILLALFISGWILGGIIYYSKTSQDLSVVFLDVGQGDAILIQRGSQQIVIDGGRDSKQLLEKLGTYVPFWDRQIEVMVVSHPDEDHIGGLVGMLRAYKVGTVIKTNDLGESRADEALREEIAKQNLPVVDAAAGANVSLGENEKLEVLYPFQHLEDAPRGESNSYSVVAKLKIDDFSFLFTGDLPSEQEKLLLERGIAVGSNVLKVGHHGSKYSSSAEFLEAVAPQEAVLSVGARNTYGHPNPEALKRLTDRNIIIRRTDQQGDIRYRCIEKEKRCALSNSL